VKKEGYLGSYWDYFGYKSRSKVVGVAGIRDFVYVRTLKPLIERMWEYMFNCVCLFVTLSTLAHQDPLSVHGISQARILESVCHFLSQGIFWPRDWTGVSCIVKQILYHWATWETLHRAWQRINRQWIQGKCGMKAYMADTYIMWIMYFLQIFIIGYHEVTIELWALWK